MEFKNNDNQNKSLNILKIKNDILFKLKKYAINIDDLCKKNLGVDAEVINENIIIAPFYMVDAFRELNNDIDIVCLYQKYYKVYNVVLHNKSFTYINCNMCAGNISEVLLALLSTPCKNIYFIGSAGSITNDIKIGDVALPNCSVIGDGTCRYFNDMKDLYGKETHPSKILFNQVKKQLDKMQIIHKTTRNFSVDAISAQYLVMDKINKFDIDTLDMETSSFFYIANILNFNAVAIHNISDNSVQNKTLYVGRSATDKQAKKHTQNVTIPSILIQLLLEG